LSWPSNKEAKEDSINGDNQLEGEDYDEDCDDEDCDDGDDDDDGDDGFSDDSY
jgi:hypothetical protein